MRRAQEILGHADVRTTLAIYTHSMRRAHDDSADKIAALAGLSAPLSDLGNNRETIDPVARRNIWSSRARIPGYLREATAHIGRGENAGRTVKESNIVLAQTVEREAS
jgi:hypothetical protein